MSRHSKNNTARGHFTYAEMQMLDYGTKKQRLGRDSMRDYDACFLCLQTARDPVCCPEGHIACKECIYENILAQKQEIQRQAQQVEIQAAKEAQEQENKELLAQQIILDEFEKSQMGVLSKAASVRTKGVAGSGVGSPGSPATTSSGDSNGKGDKKRAFELDTEELERISKQERIDVAKAIEDEAKSKKPVLPSFWVPSLTPSNRKTEYKATKLHTMCTASDKEHKLSLKNLIPVKFEMAFEDHDGEDSTLPAKQSAICPICRKGFTNTTKLSILKSCGHVFCDSCCSKFVKKEGKCQTCGSKTKDKEIVSMTGEGSGFSGGGAKEAKKFDVAFQ
ncbi:hypothetical protein BGZ95_000640 [Linnemannia exigua]|uniref:RING-type domain-containing protein n=1 Tax=Linnemannia exigua TaxID=604196 RepID=A0AAD4H5H8_9FUNG|nr:hypothetical protein BGZ95_000640 [Linnemannia exigua]